MPCYTVQTQSVELKTADPELLKLALKALNIKFTEAGKILTLQTTAGQIVLRNGQAEYSSYNADAAQKVVNQIKQAYSREAITKISKKYKFNLTNKTGTTITLRRY